MVGRGVAQQARRVGCEMKGINDYCFDDKNRWRVMMWHKIAARCGKLGRLRDAVTLYLPGPQDNDRDVAVRKGFSNQNLIAVDVQKAHVEALRASGVPAIHGELTEVLMNWRHSSAPSVVFGDFCGGLHQSLVEPLCEAIYLMPMGKNHAVGCSGRLLASVLAFNFQRGRDAWSNRLRAAMGSGTAAVVEDEGGVHVRACNDADVADSVGAVLSDLGLGGEIKHRGREFMFHLYLRLRAGFLKMGLAPDKKLGRHADLLIKAGRPEFLSYRSPSGIIMDSVVFTLAGHTRFNYGDRPDERWLEECDTGMHRQIAAVMAHRTMRTKAA